MFLSVVPSEKVRRGHLSENTLWFVYSQTKEHKSFDYKRYIDHIQEHTLQRLFLEGSPKPFNGLGSVDTERPSGPAECLPALTGRLGLQALH